MAARAQRREYMQLLADCQRVYCEVRLLLVADVVAARMAEYSREQLPSLTRSGCSYLMQACAVLPYTCTVAHRLGRPFPTDGCILFSVHQSVLSQHHEELISLAYSMATYVSGLAC